MTDTLTTPSVTPVRRVRHRTLRQRIPNLALYAYLTIVAIFAIGPLLLAWSTAFKTRPQVVENPYGLPIPPTFDNLIEAWTTGRFSVYFFSSLIISLASVVGMVIVASLAGYGLARMKFWGRRFVILLLLLGLTIPITAIVLPLYTIMRDLGLLNTYASVVITHIAVGLPFFAFLMRAFFLRLPDALEDAARVDGASELRIFWSVMLPLVRPGVLTVALLEFLWTWNNLLLPLVFLTSESVRTLPIGMLLLNGRFNTDYGLLSAAVIILTLPVIALFLFFQRSFVAGLTSGAVKD